MSISQLIDAFIHPDRFKDLTNLRRSRIFVKACLITSIFSASYIGFSILFDYEKGIWLMVYNAFGFLILSLTTRTRLSIDLLGNIYVFIGASAVIILAYFSGGIYSALYPWIISIPVLTLLVVGRKSALFWGIVSFGIMIWMGIAASHGFVFPVEYNDALRAQWFLSVVPGLLLIVLLMCLAFERNQMKALKEVETINAKLHEQKTTITEQTQRLEKIVEEKDYIIKILAHDLRNPLNNISSLVGLMSIENEKERISQYNNMILEASENAKHLVNKVLELDASQEGNVKLSPENIIINDILYEAIGSMKDTALAKDIKLELKESREEMVIYADRTYLGLILENLISNAIKFSERSMKVVLSSIRESDSAIIKVIDQGPGINSDEQRLLFQKFTKLSPRPTAGESSTGLGLSLVKRYVELLEGNVYYEEQEGVGAVFVLEFPIIKY